MGVTPLRPPAKEALTVPNGYKKIEVYFPDAEYEAFLKKVKRTNLSISAFVRKMAAEQVIREAPHADVPYLMREVKRVGNNINQLLFLANSKGFFDKAALTNALKELREVDKLIFDVFSKANTLPHIHPHAFRHTAASTMILNGVDMVSAAAELGHASPSTTANIYAHQFAIARAKAASVRAGVFANRK